MLFRSSDRAAGADGSDLGRHVRNSRGTPTFVRRAEVESPVILLHKSISKNRLDKSAKIAYNKSKESTPVDGLLP